MVELWDFPDSLVAKMRVMKLRVISAGLQAYTVKLSLLSGQEHNFMKATGVRSVRTREFLVIYWQDSAAVAKKTFDYVSFQNDIGIWPQHHRIKDNVEDILQKCPSVQERLLVEQILTNMKHPSTKLGKQLAAFPLLFGLEWDAGNGWRGDVVLCNINRVFLVIEVKYIDAKATGPTARRRRTAHRREVQNRPQHIRGFWKGSYWV
jgi:hypothetical protein